MRRFLVAIVVILCGVAVIGALLMRHPSGQAAAGRSGAPPTGAQVRASTVRNVQGDGADEDDDGAQASAPAARRAPARAAPVWTVDKAASRLSFRGVMQDIPFDGVFRSWDAQIAFDPDNLANSHAAITVDTTSALTGQPIKDQALPNSEWLDTEAFPQATLITRSIRQTGPGRYEATADVHIRGVAWRAVVPFSVAISHDTGRMDATLPLDRRTFGIGEGPFRSPAPVEPTVQVVMKLVAKRTR